VPDDGVIRVGCERRRAGTVTTIHGLAAGERATVAGDLKRRCGTGGTVKNDTVELQGDHRDAAIAHLASLGRHAKRMGG
jgi:translation initiation factor 1